MKALPDFVSFRTSVSDFTLLILVVQLESVVVGQQLVVLLLEVELVPVADLLVSTVLLVAVALDAQALVLVIEFVQAALLVLDLGVQVLNPALLVGEVALLAPLLLVGVDFGQVVAEQVQNALDLVQMLAP